MRPTLLIALALSAGPVVAAVQEPFDRMSQETVKTLKDDEKFDGFEKEVFVARPFVILMTHKADADKQALEERKKRLGSLAQGIWRNWLNVREKWQLKSNREDTLDQPEPFVWISFHDEDSYDGYMKKFRTKSTPGSQAFYSTETNFVYTREDPQRDPSIILIHETIHQLMDRFSEVPSTKYQNYCFTEGVPEFFAGHRGEGESLVLGQLNRPRRADEIRRLHTYFDAGQKVIYPLHENQNQITPDDWILYDVPLLLTLRDKMWTTAIGEAMIKGFQRSDYMTREKCRNYVNDGSVNFHSAFYAFSWAFSYWLREKHPEAHDRYARIVLNTDRGGDAESFLEAFKIEPASPLPDILALVGPDNRDVQKNMQKAVKCLDQRLAILRQTPAIQEMHREWADWMRATFPKLEDAIETSSLGNLSQEQHPAIDRVILKGDAPKMVYVPIIHDDEFSRHYGGGMKGVTEVMARCEEIADGLYNGYGVRHIILEGVPKTFADTYNRVPLAKRKPAPADGSGSLVHKTWSRLLAGKQWVLLPAADKPLVGPLTALGREYDARIIAVLDEAKKSGWLRGAESFTQNKDKLQASLAAVAEEYNTKRREVLEKDPGMKKEYAITVTQRNKSFLDNLLAAKTPGVAFFGVAHWPDIERQLGARKVSYAVVVPKGVPWPPAEKDAAAIESDMLKLGAKLKKTAITLGDGAKAEITIPFE